MLHDPREAFFDDLDSGDVLLFRTSDKFGQAIHAVGSPWCVRTPRAVRSTTTRSVVLSLTGALVCRDHAAIIVRVTEADAVTNYAIHVRRRGTASV